MDEKSSNVPSKADSSDSSPSELPRRTSTVRMEASFAWSAPLPPPDLLKQYNDVFPGCAERIVAMAESQAAHRQAIEDKVIHGNVSSQKTGLWLGFVLALIIILSGAWLVYTGHIGWGAIFTGIPLVSLVSVFVLGKRSQGRQLEAHRGVERQDPQRELPFPED